MREMAAAVTAEFGEPNRSSREGRRHLSPAPDLETEASQPTQRTKVWRKDDKRKQERGGKRRRCDHLTFDGVRLLTVYVRNLFCMFFCEADVLLMQSESL